MTPKITHILTLIIAFMTSNSFAYDSWVEMKSTTPEIWKIQDTYRKLDSESDSHLINYRQSLEQDFKFLRSDKILDMYAGSVSSNEFQNDYRLKLETPLTEKLSAHFYFQEQGSYEYENSIYMLSMRYAFSPRWTLEVVGNTHYQKEQNDLGFGAFLNSDVGRFHFRYLMSDFQRNDRRVGDYEWVKGKEPIAFTLTWLHPDKDFYIYSQIETRSQAQSISTSKIRDSSRQVFGTWSIWPLSTTLKLKNRTQYDNGYTEDSLYKQQLQRLMVSQTLEQDFSDYQVAGTLHLLSRSYHLAPGKAKSLSLIPAVWVYKGPHSLGYDFTFFRSQLAFTETTEFKNNEATENRLSYAYTWDFNSASSLSLFFTFDIDKFGTSKTWEGGAGKFSMTF